MRANRAIAEAARGRTDVDCAIALPRDLGEWRPTVEFALGPYASARDLDEVSAQDLSRSVERDIGAFCRQGYGALLAKFASGSGTASRAGNDRNARPGELDFTALPDDRPT